MHSKNRIWAKCSAFGLAFALVAAGGLLAGGEGRAERGQIHIVGS